jgi:uncharacterized protein YdaU (DUF1376 family)
MHYYQFNIGDYASHTRNLGLFEDLAYRRLLDEYYLHERPFNACSATVARHIGMAEHKDAVEFVLQTFFVLQDCGWTNKRAEKEIAHFRSKSEAASRAGKASAERRLNDRSTTVQPTNNHKPITNNHKPIKKLLAPEGVSSEVWDSFVQQRQKTRAVVTETVIKTIQKEADLAGWPLERALSEIVARGWRGFKAEWVKDKQENKLLTFAERDELAKRKKWEEMTGRKWPEPGQPAERLMIL